MINFTTGIALLATICSSFLVFYLTKNVRFVLIHLLLLLITPWIYTLVLNKPTLIDYLNAKPLQFSFLKNFALITSTDFIFFENFTKLKYIVGEHGGLLPSFIPLVLAGLWSLLSDKDKKNLVVSLFFVLILLGSLFLQFVGYLAVFPFLSLLSVFSTLGLIKFIKIFKLKTSPIAEALILANIIMIIYETLILFHNINVQMSLKV